MYDGTTWKGWRWGTQPKKLNEQKWNVIFNFNYQTREALHLYLCLLPSKPSPQPGCPSRERNSLYPVAGEAIPGREKDGW